jgi:hypothetical protein
VTLSRAAFPGRPRAFKASSDPTGFSANSLRVARGRRYARRMSEKEVTTAMLLQHMRGMEQRLSTRVERLDEKLTTRIDGVDAKLTQRIDRLDARIDRLEANLTRQIDGIDKRLDAIEIEHLPKRVARIEAHLHLEPV